MYNLSNTIFKNFVIGALGFFLGILNNVISLYAHNILNITNTLLKVLLHLFISCVILALLQYYFNYFSWIWKNVTSELFFVSFFFGVQYNIFSDTITYIVAIFEKK
jgi:hypothetical protein